MIKTNQVKIIKRELLKSEKFENDFGGFYTEETFKVTDSEGVHYIDVVYDAPWQVGGNSGQVRELRPLKKDEV